VKSKLKNLIKFFLILHCCQNAYAAYQNSPCALQLRAELKAKLNESTTDEFLASQGLTLKITNIETPDGPAIRYAAVDSDSKVVSHIDYIIKPIKKWGFTKSYSAKFVLNKTDPDYQGRYLSTALYRNFVKDNPKVSEVHGILALVNAKEFAKEYDKSRDLEAGIRATPFYKSMGELGFSEVDLTQSKVEPGVLANKWNVTVVLKKPNE